jgi:hypothetical protein
MSEIVFILGAGASAQAGAPLMSGFLDKAAELHTRNPTYREDAKFDLVFKARHMLQAVHSKVDFDIHNLESIFSAFEMAKMIGRLGNLHPEQEIDKLPSALRHVITRTLIETVRFKRDKAAFMAPIPYPDFAQLILDYIEQGRQCSIITFNYDIAVDCAFAYSGKELDYGFGDSWKRRAVRLMKMHGSLNWVKRSNLECEDPIYRMPLTFTRDDPERLHVVEKGADDGLDVIHYLSKSTCPSCQQKLPIEPLIVPPTWDKTQHQNEIASVWRKAGEELSDAESIFVCGYSLPSTDQFFRYLFALGTTGKAIIKQFWVFDPDKDGKVEPRYRELIGRAIMDRFHFEHYEFRQVANFLRKAVKV